MRAHALHGKDELKFMTGIRISLVFGTCLVVEQTLMFTFRLLPVRQLIMSALGQKQTFFMPAQNVPALR